MEIIFTEKLKYKLRTNLIIDTLVAPRREGQNYFLANDFNIYYVADWKKLLNIFPFPGETL